MTPISELPSHWPFRFPAPSEPETEWRLCLPPFTGYENGWSGSVDQFLTHVRDETIRLEHVPLTAVVDGYVARINDLALDQAGELIHVAASLIYYKSKLLLPSDPALEKSGEALCHEILSEITAGQRIRRDRKESQIRAPEQNNLPVVSADLSLLDLFVLLNEVEQILLADSTYLVSNPQVTVANQLQWLSERLSHPGFPVETADALLMLHHSNEAKICLFLALLEMVKRGQIRLAQSVAFGEISIHPVKEQNQSRSADQ